VTERFEAAHRAWDSFRWTNALLATADEPNRAPGQLSGLMFSVKDTFATADLPSTGGSLLLKDHVPDHDAVFVARLRASGATLFAKGNCAEFGNGIHTETRIGGRVMHPFDPLVSAGGSSGGDAVAVAAGITDFSIGGDYGGSVRWPAQCVGVYGLRTSVGLVPRTGRMPSAGGTRASPCIGPPAPVGLLSEVEAAGVLARSPEMIARVLDVIAGPDGLDWSGLAASVPPTVRHQRIAVTSGREAGPLAADAREALREAIDAAKAAGFEIVDVEGILAGAFESYNALRADLDSVDDLRTLVGGDISLVCPATRQVLDAPPGRGWASEEARAAWAESRTIIARIKAVFSEVDGLLVPVAATSAVSHDGGVEVDGRWITGPDLMAQCRAISLTGLPSLACPVLPVGTGARGRTTSVQIVGPPGGDWQCCQIAAELGLGGDLCPQEPM
jgi:amidase